MGAWGLLFGKQVNDREGMTDELQHTQHARVGQRVLCTRPQIEAGA